MSEYPEELLRRVAAAIDDATAGHLHWDTQARAALDAAAATTKAAKGCPACPTCKEPLVARPTERRFMEDDLYAECPNGHVWKLTDAASEEQS